MIAIDDMPTVCAVDTVFPRVPERDWAVLRRRYPSEFVAGRDTRLRMGAYVIRDEREIVVVDTGDPEGGELLVDLRRLGIDRAAVSRVFLTHAHLDHLGGIRRDGTLAFPQAEHLISSRERTTASEPAAAILDDLDANGLLSTFEEGEDVLGPGLEVVPLPGHTPGHCGILVGDRLLIAADACHHVAQLHHVEWTTSWDADPEAATTTRRAMLTRVEADGLLLTCCHFPAAFRQPVRDGDHLAWE